MARDIIVVGGSAGSLDALTRLARDLPGDLPATVFVVMHTSPEAPGVLPRILERQAALPVAYGTDGERIRPGRIVVAPPDHHLFLEDGRVCTIQGPRENRFRPAVDPLFRSAALSHGPRVAGVILSGLLDDVTHGLHMVKRCGGVAVVQDVDDALFSSMPASAIEKVEVDHVLPASAMADLLDRLARNQADPGAEMLASQDERLGALARGYAERAVEAEPRAAIRALLESHSLRAAREVGRRDGGRAAKEKRSAGRCRPTSA